MNECLFYIETMKPYIHARLGDAHRAALEQLKKATGLSESEIVRRGLRLAAQEEQGRRSALGVAGRRVGRFRSGPRDLSTNGKRLEGFGE